MTTEEIKVYLQYWKNRYRAELVDNIMPFWMKNGFDRVNGGVYTCLDRDGKIYDTTKSVWFQGRFGFIAAFAYNNIERKPEWLEASRSCIDFIEQHCTDERGRMYFEVEADGTPIRMRRYVFSECFAAIAMSEYSIASGDKTYAEKALKVFNNIHHFVATPGILPTKYCDSVKTQGHSLTMILINTASRIRAAITDPALDEQISQSIAALKKYFVHPELKALLECVGPNGEFIDTIAGRTINPGHCIESVWFLLEEAKHRSWDNDITSMALEIFDWSWQWGWDEQYGGIINFRDALNRPCQDYSQDMKFWWPQCETIISSLYAYLATGDERFIERHRLISDWTYAHFPDNEYGEWYGYLHRDGSVAQPAKGNIFKGPFHVPRMLIKSYMLCNEILDKLNS